MINHGCEVEVQMFVRNCLTERGIFVVKMSTSFFLDGDASRRSRAMTHINLVINNHAQMT